MSTIPAAFERLAKERRAAYVPYICAGDPSESFTVDLASRLCSSGADLLELGLPFSDPVGDGPVIQEAMNRALSGGFQTGQLFGVIGKLRERKVSQPIVIMSYFNPILRYGPERFCSDAARAGADGLLVVDLPIEESDELDAAARANGLDAIRLIAPTTSEMRMNRILSAASGFVYAVSVSGVTGARSSLSSSAIALLTSLKARSKLPVLLGFGISAPQHVIEAVGAGAAGVVEGSALVRLYADHLDDPQLALDMIDQHAREMKTAAVAVIREK